MTLCLNCQKEVEPKEGKRAKKYCSDTCRATHYQKTHPKGEKKYVLMKTHQKVLEELKELRSKVRFASETTDSYDGKPDTGLKLDEAGQAPPPPPKQEPPAQTPILSYQELLRLAPSMDTREKREEFLKEVTRNRKLNANQKEAIHKKLPNFQ
jgi:hypothetical protein